MKSLILALAVAVPLVAQITSYPTSQIVSGQLQINQPNGVPQLDANGRTGTAQTSSDVKTIPDSALFAWHASLANYNNSGATIWNIGNSYSQGSNANPSTKIDGFVFQSITRLSRDYGIRGPGFIDSTRSDVFAQTGTWTPVSTLGMYQSGGAWPTFGDVLQGGGSATLTLTGYSGSVYEIYYYTNTDTASGFTVQVDGGAGTVYGATTTGTPTIAKATVSVAGAVKTHTILITAPASGNAYIQGVAPVVSTTNGVEIENYSRSGAISAAFVGTHAFDILSLKHPGLISWSMMEINDFIYNIPVATYQSNMTTALTSALSYGGSCLVVSAPNILQSTNANGNTLQDFRNASKTVASQMGCAYYSVADSWGTYAQAVSAGLMDSGDGVHPLTAGHNELTTMWLNRILEGGSVPSKAGTVLYGLVDNGTAVVNGDSSATSPSQFVFQGVANPNIQGTIGINTSASNGYLSLQSTKQGTANTPIALNPSGGAVCVGCTNGVNGYGETVRADSTQTAPQQIVIQGSTNANQELFIGYNTTSDYGSIQAFKQTVGNQTLQLNPLGGNVQIPSIKATTGTRYVCVDTAGNITSSATACSGT